MATTTSSPIRDLAAPARRSRRPWRDKFREAARGVKLGVRGHSSFFVHFFAAALVVAAALVLQCPLVEWCVLLGCVGAVLTAELFNSALEMLLQGLDVSARHRLRNVLDTAAGAVLTVSITAAVIGVLILGQRLGALLGL